MSERRERLSTLLAAEVGDAERAEMDQITAGLREDEVELRAAIAIEPDAETVAKNGEGEVAADRLELRQAAKVGNILKACLGSGSISGAEAELQAELGLDPNHIPIELWEPEKRAAEGEPEKRAVSAWGANDTVGVNMAPIQPFVFAETVASKLMIEMPTQPSGDYATATISGKADADAVAQSSAVPENAATFTVQSTRPHRVGGSVGVSVEDIARVGTDSYEPRLKEHLSAVLTDEVDDQMLNGNGVGANINGLLSRLTFPTDAIDDVTGFDDFVAAFADQIDGLWASKMLHVSILAGVASYKLSAKTFRDLGVTVRNAADDENVGGYGSNGPMVFSDYAEEHTAGWWTNKRMPAAASNVQNGIACLKGRSMSLATCPHWGYIGIDDIYTGRLKGERYFTVFTMIGDVIVRQPDAYQPVRFKVA